MRISKAHLRGIGEYEAYDQAESEQVAPDIMKLFHALSAKTVGQSDNGFLPSRRSPANTWWWLSGCEGVARSAALPLDARRATPITKIANSYFHYIIYKLILKTVLEMQ